MIPPGSYLLTLLSINKQNTESSDTHIHHQDHFQATVLTNYQDYYKLSVNCSLQAIKFWIALIDVY